MPVRAPLSSYPGQYKFRVWVRKNPLSVARFVDPAAPRVVLATQHEGHHSGTLARPDGLTVPGCACNPVLHTSPRSSPLQAPDSAHRVSRGRPSPFAPAPRTWKTQVEGVEASNRMGWITFRIQPKDKRRLADRQPFRTALTILTDCTYRTQGYPRSLFSGTVNLVLRLAWRR